jgi:hypothetical protein
MANRPSNGKDRSHPRNNKSQAIRAVLTSKPTAKAAEIVEAVKKQYGQTVSANMVYMVKTKHNMAHDGGTRRRATSNGQAMTAASWIDAIGIARELVQATGSTANATALLKAIED